MNKTFALIASLAVAVSQANAASFFTGDTTNGITRADGTTALTSGSVLYGTFTAGFDVAANVNDFAALDAAFIQVIGYNGASNLAPGVFNLTGLTYNEGAAFETVQYDLSADTSNVVNDIAGSTVYAWVLNDTTPSNATEHAIFTKTGSTWTDAQTPGSNATSFSWATTTGTDVLALAGTVLGGANIGGSANSHSLQAIGAVPEPSRAVLGFLGLGALFFRRRR
tara:strand:+ start:908 stop:1579 length:672 start_codon:yes stop_codon:yes gene_type:complete